MGPDTMILVFWMLSFKPTFSFSYFTFIKRLFSSSSLFAIRVVSSTYLRLLIFLPAVLMPACASSAFLMMYSAYKLNKQGGNMQPWHTPFPIWNQSVICPVLTVASWPAYRFLRRQVRWSGIPISLIIFHSLWKCSNYWTTALISHARKVMLKILQVRLQQYVNHELPDIQAEFRKGRGTMIKLPTFLGSWRPCSVNL